MMYDCMFVLIHVSKLVGEFLVGDQVHRFCFISLFEYDNWVELIMLEIVDFYIILGKD